MKYLNHSLVLSNRSLSHPQFLDSLFQGAVGALVNPIADIFGLGPTSATKDTNEKNLQAVRETNEANRQIAQETNLANQAIAHNTNASNIQMNSANNALQMRLQEAMNEYNSIGAQLKRAEQAGVNPNAVIGGSLSGNLQTTLPSTTAGHSDSIPMQTGAPMIPPSILNGADEKIGMLNAISNMANTYSQTQLNKANEKKVNQETEWWTTQNKFEERCKQLGLEMNEQQIAKLKLDCDEVAQRVKNSQEVFNQLKAQTAMMNEQAKMIAIDALYHEDFVTANLKILTTEADYSEDMAKYTLEKIKADIGVARSTENLNYARSRLTAKEIELCEKNIDIAEQGRQQAVYETALQKKYGEHIRWNELNNLRHQGRVTGQEYERLKYENSEDQREYIRSIQGAGAVSGVLNSVSNTIATGAQVRSSFKGKPTLKGTESYKGPRGESYTKYYYNN